MKNIEIERKWLVNNFPDMPYFNEIIQEQAYLAFTPVTVRIRKTSEQGKADSFCLCFKGKGGLVRAEVEQVISREKYEDLRQMLVYASAVKKLRLYKLAGGEILECSCVDEGGPSEFYYAEVEFSSEQAAKKFTPPQFLANEVTGEKGYSMAAYCKNKSLALPSI